MAKKDMAGAAAKESYEASVAVRALERAGKCPQLKGHIHEVMFCDKYNVNPVNILKGNHADLTKSTVAKMKDVVMTDRAGHVIGHAQLKDTISNSGAAKTAKQILSGHYNKTVVYGTEETAAKVGKKLAGKAVQKVNSSGISSETTSSIANKALGKMPTMGALGNVAKSGGIAGAAFGAGIEAVSSISDVIDGKKDVGDAVIDVAGAGIKGGITGAASAAAGSAAAGVAGAAITAVAGTAATGFAVAAAPVAIGVVAATAVGSFVSSLFD